MPLVGNKAANNKPNASAGCSAKKIRPKAKATKGINKKFIAKAHSCTVLPPGANNCFGLTPTIMGYTINRVSGAIKALRLSVGSVRPTAKPNSINNGILKLKFLLNHCMYFILKLQHVTK